MTGKPSIVLADDHPLVRRGMRAILEEAGLRVAGEAGTGEEALQMILRLKPHVALVDLMMQGMNGLEVTRQISKRSPATRVVIVSMLSSETYVVEALRNGASGYVLKDSGERDLVDAVNEAHAGRRFLSRPLTLETLEACAGTVSDQSPDPYETLSPRERDMLQFCAEGLSAAESAARLHISPRTAEGHRYSLMHKLGLRNQSELILFALERGIISRP